MEHQTFSVRRHFLTAVATMAFLFTTMKVGGSVSLSWGFVLLMPWVFAALMVLPAWLYLARRAKKGA